MATIRKWGESKLIAEEAILGALIVGAFGLLAGAALLPAPAFRGGLALLGFDFDGGRSAAWAAGHWWAAALGFSLPFATALCGAMLGFYLFGWQRSQWHYSGMEYVPDPEDYMPQFAAHERALFTPDQTAAMRSGAKHPRGVEVGGVELSRTREVGHMVVYGVPGSGKTTLLRGILARALARGDRTVIHDIKGDFLAALGRSELAEKVVILGPWDARSRPWAIGRDVNTPERAVAFSAGFFDASNAGQNAFFVDSARELLAGLIKHLQKRRREAWSWRELAGLLAAPPQVILMAAHDGEPMTQSLAPDAEGKETRSVLAQLMSRTVWIGAYAQAFGSDAKPFSISDWLADPGQVQAVVINNDLRYAERGAALYGAFLGALASIVASPVVREQSVDASGWWLVVDELPQLGEAARKAVQLVEETARSKGWRVVKAMQDASQLDARSGKEKAEAERSVQQSRIYCKLATGTAAQIARDLGERDIRRVELPQVVGAGNKRIVAERAPVIRPDDLMGLRVLRDGPMPGVEIIVQVDDLIGRLVQPFANVWPSGGDPLIPNPRWDIADTTRSTANGSGRVEQGGNAHALALVTDDLPFSLDQEMQADPSGDYSLNEPDSEQESSR